MTPSISKIKFGLLLALLAVSMIGRVSGQIFVINDAQFVPSIIGYNFDGTYNTTVPLAENANPENLRTDGTNLFVVDEDGGSVGEYTASGGVVNTSLISGLTYPFAMAVSGTNLFVADSHQIGKYSTTGAIINTNLVPGVAGGWGMAVIGTNVYLATGNSIVEFTVDGALVNASLVSGLTEPMGLDTDGTNLYVAFNSGVIAKYSPSGTAISSLLVSENNAANFISVLGNNLYALNGLQMIGEYSTSGATVNPSLIALPSGYFLNLVAIPIIPTGPPPTVGVTTYSNQPVAIWPVNGASYTLQITNQTSGNWVTVSNYQAVTGAIITNAPPSAFFRLQPAGQ
jgi:hypothetical protein